MCGAGGRLHGGSGVITPSFPQNFLGIRRHSKRVPSACIAIAFVRISRSWEHRVSEPPLSAFSNASNSQNRNLPFQISRTSHILASDTPLIL